MGNGKWECVLGFDFGLLKYYFNKPEMVKTVGMAHGVLFVLYVVFLLLVHLQYKWSILKTLGAFIASLIPFGTFYADKKWFRNA